MDQRCWTLVFKYRLYVFRYSQIQKDPDRKSRRDCVSDHLDVQRDGHQDCGGSQ